MTRFKELQRIENAIKNEDRRELEWALDYCKVRLSIVSRKDHQKYWRNLEKDVRTVLARTQSD